MMRILTATALAVLIGGFDAHAQQTKTGTPPAEPPREGFGIPKGGAIDTPQQADPGQAGQTGNRAGQAGQTTPRTGQAGQVGQPGGRAEQAGQVGQAGRPEQAGQAGAQGAQAEMSLDMAFAEAAAASGLAEVVISQIGLQRSQDTELKRYSEQMIQEHDRLNRELITVATEKRAKLPRTVDARARFCAMNLQTAPRDQFDHCYAKAQFMAHMEAISLFEAQAERGQDPDLKALAAKALPHIREHLETIRPIAMRLEKDHQGSQGIGTRERQTKDADTRKTSGPGSPSR